MKLLHVSDIHFGVENYSRIDPETGLPSRLRDFVNAFDRAIEAALAHNVDAVLFTGDAYKNRDPNPTVQREFALLIRKLSKHKIPVFLLTGNHDLPSMHTRAHSIEIFETLSVPGVHVAKTIQLITLKTKSGPLQIISLPWLTRHNLLTKEEHRGRTLDDLNHLMVTKMSNLLNEKIGQLNSEYPAVLAVHASIAGAVYSSERDIMLGQDFTLQKSLLSAENFDYIAVGHIHKHQVLEAGGVPIVYPGSLERINFGEEADEKGFVIVEIENPPAGSLHRRTSWSFIRDEQVRAFRTLDLNIADVETNDLLNPTAAAVQSLQQRLDQANGKGVREAIVRVRLKLSEEQRKALRENEFRRALDAAGAFYIAGVDYNVETTRRIRLGGASSIEGLTPLELLEKYLESRSISSERIELLLKHAKGLIHGSPEF